MGVSVGRRAGWRLFRVRRGGKILSRKVEAKTRNLTASGEGESRAAT